MAKKLRLLADVYSQPQKDDRPDRRQLVTRSKGEVFEPVDQAEYDRLVEIGAAEDPAEVQKRKEEDLERRRAELEAERDRIDAELKGAKGPEDLSSHTRPELDKMAADLGVPEPDKLPNKDAVIAAIEAARASIPPQP